MSSMQEQCIALAGVFQATSLVESLAKSGNCDRQSLHTSIASVFVTDPDSTISVYSDINNIALGLKVLIENLENHTSSTSPDSLRYAMNLFHLQKKLQGRPEMLSVIGQRLDKCQLQLEHFEATHDNIIGALADIYSDTLSTFSFRIQVKGNFNQLQQPRNANLIRALLLAGIRSTMLWRQLGGSRLKLLWQKSKLLDCAREHYSQLTPPNKH